MSFFSKNSLEAYKKKNWDCIYLFWNTYVNFTGDHFGMFCLNSDYLRDKTLEIKYFTEPKDFSLTQAISST